jgi:hypothetical protein
LQSLSLMHPAPASLPPDDDFPDEQAGDTSRSVSTTSVDAFRCLTISIPPAF